MTLADPTLDDAEVGRTMDLLGGRRTVHRAVQTRLDAHDLIRDGLPGHALRHLVDDVALLRAPRAGGLEKAVGISLRTYQRRKDAPDRKLSPEQSGRAWKFAQILARASALFGSRTEAEAWLQRPATALDGRAPLDLLSTPAGVEAIEEHLTRLEYGVYT